MTDTCAHERITTASADGLPSLWYCDDCRRRFYPACETCVDVGHRKTHTTPTPAPAAVAAWLAEDDRLARALHVTGLNSIGKAPGHHGKFTERCICNGDAAAIIRALTDTTSADEEAIR